MGANAQTSVPVFTAGQVLTAQQQTEINTGIPVFATTTTRDAAFGGTGEKTLAEGQFAYIEASNTTQYYDGSAWQTVGSSGLVYITGTSFTTVSSFTLPTSCMSSTYKFYVLSMNLTNSSTNGGILAGQLRYGTTTQASGYYASRYCLTSANTTDNQFSSNATSWIFGKANTGGGYQIIFSNMGVSQTPAFWGQGEAHYDGGVDVFGGYGSVQQTYDGAIISVQSGNMSGYYTLHGYSTS
jgi:hypothetical protein